VRDFAWFLLLIPRNLGVLLIRGYRAVISPLYGDVCRYYPSCSAYGLGSVQQRGLLLGSLLTAWRILRCNPWSAGGIDDVRAARHSRYRVTPFGWVVPTGWSSAAGYDRADAAAPAASHSPEGHDHAAHLGRSHDRRDEASAARIDAAHTLSPTVSRKD
jgi:putative membrane protein insertion efficiency factor